MITLENYYKLYIFISHSNKFFFGKKQIFNLEKIMNVIIDENNNKFFQECIEFGVTRLKTILKYKDNIPFEIINKTPNHSVILKVDNHYFLCENINLYYMHFCSACGMLGYSIESYINTISDLERCVKMTHDKKLAHYAHNSFTIFFKRTKLKINNLPKYTHIDDIILIDANNIYY